MLNINDKGLNFQVMGMSPIKKIMQGGSIHSKRSTISSKVKQNGKKNIAIRRNDSKSPNKTIQNTKTHPEFFRNTFSNLNSSEITCKNTNLQIDRNNTNEFDLSDMIFKENDDYKTLVNKNSKLRNLLVQASDKLNEVSSQLKEKEKDFDEEKATILKELDQISSNYKKYAQCYKCFSILDEQYTKLQIDYNHNYNVMRSYQETLSCIIKDFMNLFKLIFAFSIGKIDKNPIEFLYELKDITYNNLTNYKGAVDNLNFSYIFEEYNSILNSTTNFFKQTKEAKDCQIMNEGVQNISNKNTEEENNIPIEEKKSITQNVHKYKKNHETNKNSSRLDNIKPKFPLKNTQTFKPNKIEVENIKTDNESKSRPISANRHNMNVTIYSLKTGLNNKSRDENNGETDNNINNTDPNYRHKMNRKNSSRLNILSRNQSTKNLKIVRNGSPEIKNLVELGRKIFNFQNNKGCKPIDAKFVKNDINPNAPGTSSTARTYGGYDT